ncbi:amphi-Trp domain-containing protein [Pseudodesulfovibrio indicus]|uniref:amphi-Trp domain-containing protein n=1 Tax=Pseudodesulfovibrio indicus TaxID=1716143 RepID=UPI002930CFCD|nr:amphi-Trp domain-containing protein [Pseudodesulfovibrio indicus]
MEKQKISVKKVLEYKEAVGYMEDLARSLKSGSIVIESGEEHVVMTPSAQVAIKVEAKIKDGKQKVAFELSWTDAPRADLKISDTEPAAPPATRPEPAAPATQTEAQPPATREEAAPPAKTAPKAPKADDKSANKAKKKPAKPQKAPKKAAKPAKKQ